MPVRVSATDRIRTKIDALFAEDRELPEILEEVARLGAQLLMQVALLRASHCGSACATPMTDQSPTQGSYPPRFLFGGSQAAHRHSGVIRVSPCSWVAANCWTQPT